MKAWMMRLASLGVSVDLWRGVTATASLTAIGVGLWWERPSACLIVLGGIVLGLLVYSHLRVPEKANNDNAEA